MKRFLSILLILAAAACNTTKDTPPVTADFTITLVPSVLDLSIDEPGSVTIRINRSGGFNGAVTVSLEGETAGLVAEPITIAGTANEDTFSILARDGAALGTSFPVVKAVSGTLERSETLTLRIAASKAIVLETRIGNGGSRQVRQGSGELTLEVTGRHLSRATSYALGDLPTTLLPGDSDTQVSLKVEVPHGASLGAKTLVLTTAGGETRIEDVLVVTAITAGPSGSDATGAGTPQRPYRSLTKALSVWGQGDTVSLLNGSYSTASGEAWPSQSGTPPVIVPGPNVPAGAIIEGESAAGVILAGSGGNATGLVFSGNATVTSLSLRGFSRALVAGEGTVTLTDVRSLQNDEGLFVYGNATVTLRGNSALLENIQGLIARGGAVVVLEATAVHDNLQAGIMLEQGSRAALTGAKVHHNATGVVVSDDAFLSVVSSEIYENSGSGLQATDNATVSMSGSKVYGNSLFGIDFGGTELTVRESEIYENTDGGAGIFIQGSPHKIDLGTISEPGNNIIRDNYGVQLLDARPDSMEPNLVFITLSATRLNELFPDPGIYIAEDTPYFLEPYFTILGINNGIRIN